MSEGQDEVKAFMTGLIFGGIIGAGLALFLTPKTGEETRQIVRDETEKAIAKGKEFAEKMKEKAEVVKEKAEEMKEKAETLRKKFKGHEEGEEL